MFFLRKKVYLLATIANENDPTTTFDFKRKIKLWHAPTLGMELKLLVNWQTVEFTVERVEQHESSRILRVYTKKMVLKETKFKTLKAGFTADDHWVHTDMHIKN